MIFPSTITNAFSKTTFLPSLRRIVPERFPVSFTLEIEIEEHDIPDVIIIILKIADNTVSFFINSPILKSD